MISGIIDMWELVTYSGGVNTTIAAFCQAFDHYFRFEKRNYISGLKVDWIRKVQINHLNIVLCSHVVELITFLEKGNKKGTGVL